MRELRETTKGEMLLEERTNNPMLAIARFRLASDSSLAYRSIYFSLLWSRTCVGLQGASRIRIHGFPRLLLLLQEKRQGRRTSQPTFPATHSWVRPIAS